MSINNELERRRLGLEFAKQLRMLAADAPDVWVEKAVLDLAKVIDKRFTYSRELRKREILTLVKRSSDRGGMSIPELIEATGYYKENVYDLTKELEKEKVIEFRSIPSPRDDGRGRPAVRIFIKTAIFSAQKT